MRQNKTKRLLSSRALSNQSGMSLMEILAAITLIGIMGTWVTGKIFDKLQEGRQESAKIQIQKLGGMLKEYQLKCGLYPTENQGLDALISKPTDGKNCKRYPPGGFLDGKVPADPWDNEFMYTSDGRSYQLISYGSDGIEGGEDFDADINSEDL